MIGNSSSKWLAIGLALGLGIVVVFMLHSISISIQMNKQQPTTQTSQAETGIQYLYDEQNRLTAVMPIPVKLKGV